MESLTPAQRAVLTTAHNAGRVPHHTKSRTILATGQGAGPANRRYVVLANHAGLTPHGKAWYEHTADEPPDRRIDMTQTPSRVGNSEYAVDRQGRRQRLRTLMPTGDFKHTAYGNHFFSRGQVEFVVHVPVIVVGHRRNGIEYKHTTYLPATMMNIDRIMVNTRLTHANRIARVKTLVLQAYDVRTQGGQTILLEVSNETYFYDRDRPWLIDEMETEPGPHGPQTNVRLRQVMAGPVVALSLIHI